MPSKCLFHVPGWDGKSNQITVLCYRYINEAFADELAFKKLAQLEQNHFVGLAFPELT